MIIVPFCHHILIGMVFRIFIFTRNLDPQMHPPMADKGSHLDVECRQVIIRKARPRIIVGNIFGEYHTPCTLKISLVYSRKTPLQPLHRTGTLIPTQFSTLFYMAVKNHCSGCHIPPLFMFHFLDIDELILVLNIAEILLGQFKMYVF